MDLMKFVPEQLLILVAGVFVIGIFLKRTPRIPDWLIPWILLIVGVSGSIGLSGFSPTAILQGIICVGAAVLSNQLYKQTLEGLTQTAKTTEVVKEIKPEGEVTEFRE